MARDYAVEELVRTVCCGHCVQHGERRADRHGAGSRFGEEAGGECGISWRRRVVIVILAPVCFVTTCLWDETEGNAAQIALEARASLRHRVFHPGTQLVRRQLSGLGGRQSTRHARVDPPRSSSVLS